MLVVDSAMGSGTQAVPRKMALAQRLSLLLYSSTVNPPTHTRMHARIKPSTSHGTHNVTM
jgi:hypothetical protein